MNDEIVERLRLWADAVENQHAVALAVAIREAADEIERLRKERDEARHRACDLVARRCGVNRLKRKILYAQHMGWDLFKEEDEQ